MDMTARSLAEQVMGDAGNGQCAPRSFGYQGTFKDKPIVGSVRFEPMGGHCKALFKADNPLGKWLANGRGANSFTLYGKGGRMSMVTLMGLFPVTRNGSSMTLNIMGKPLVLALAHGQSLPGDRGAND